MPESESPTSLSINLYGGERAVHYTPIDESLSLTERLDASLVPPDRSLFEVAVKRAFSNWAFHVPATIAVLWLSTVIVDLAVVLSVMLGALVLVALIPALVSVVLASPRVLFRPLTRRGRNGYFWFLATTALGVVDCVVYGACFILLARAGGFAPLLPL